MEDITDYEDKWNINIDDERAYWANELLGRYIQLPESCRLCNSTNIALSKNHSLCSPYLARCRHCNIKMYLRDNTFFSLFPRTPASLINGILKMWLIEKKMRHRTLIRLVITPL